jgi:hypothetical protein
MNALISETSEVYSTSDHRWVEDPSDLWVAVALLSKSGPKEVQFTMQASWSERFMSLSTNVEFTASLLEG